MPAYRYLHLDVFTTVRLEGNQLAVVFDAAAISSWAMQAVAYEMAFSETVFVLPPEGTDTDARLRIFTPANELPMAGHPTIGATFALAHEGRIVPRRPAIVLELGVGPTSVSLEWANDDLTFAWMSQPRPVFGAAIDPAAVAEALGLDATDLVARLPVQTVSCGVPFLVVPLADRTRVDRASLDIRSFAALLRRTGIPDQGVFVFSLERPESQLTAYSRMFAPSFGIAEDPATGSASGPLGAYLVEHRAVDPATQHHMINLQGVKMRRPSRIAISIDGAPGAITAVRCGGASVLVAEGTLFL